MEKLRLTWLKIIQLSANANERHKMLIELKEDEVEVICNALAHRAKQLRLEWSVSGEENTHELSKRMDVIAKELTYQSRKNLVRSFFPGT